MKILLRPNQFDEDIFSEQKTLQVPADWNEQDSGLNFYKGLIWHKKEFTLAEAKEKRFILHFGAANYKAEVYLNGDLMGVHEGGFTPFQFDSTGQVKKSGSNLLIVALNSQRRKEYIPSLHFDWRNYGGLTGDVLLVETPATYIRDYFFSLIRINQPW